VLQTHDLLVGPVEVVSDVGYLLKQSVQGVAYSPPQPFTSSSNLPSQ
jgi:hypothetical protein